MWIEQLFTTNLWNRIIQQIEMQVNLLRQANATPKVSVHANLNGPYDFNRMPMAVNLTVRVNPTKQESHRVQLEQ